MNSSASHRLPIQSAIVSVRVAHANVVGCAEHGNEHVRLELDAAIARQDRHGGTREVREQLLAGAVLLTHRALDRLRPVLVLLAELRVAVRPLAGVRFSVFFPQQLQRHALAAQLAMQCRVVEPMRRVVVAAALVAAGLRRASSSSSDIASAAAQSSPAWLAWAANFETAPTLMPIARLICRCVRPHAHFSRRTSFLRMLIRGVGIGTSPAKGSRLTPSVNTCATPPPDSGLRSGYVITRFGPVIAHSGIVITRFETCDQRSRSTETGDHDHSESMITIRRNA